MITLLIRIDIFWVINLKLDITSGCLCTTALILFIHVGFLECLSFKQFKLIGRTTIYRVEALTGIKFITWKLAIFVKNPEAGRFLFFLAHILTYMVFAYLLPEVRNHPQLFFFKMEGYVK
jgi:hypothetical protein